MKKVLFLLSLLLMLTFSVKVLAQSKPKAGDTVSGVVADSVSPLMGVYITELDSADRAVAYAYTDLKGEFSFSLVNAKDRIQFSYYRKEKIVLPIDKDYFEIRMQDDKDLPPIDWEDFAPLDSRLIDHLREIDSKNQLGVSDPGIPQTPKIIRGPEVQHEYVDLGLSVKWATCNVGADSPEDYGDYYAWGELEPKEKFSWANYRFRTRGNDEAHVRFNKYTSMYYTAMLDADHRYYIADNKTRLDLEDDVAHVKWGGNWRLPTDEEMNELVDSCTWTWTTLNGVNGCLVTSNRSGYTDRSIFLPAAGKYAFEPNNKSVGIWGHYWSSSVNRDKTSHSASVLCFSSSYYAVKIDFRNHGQSIRPVCP